MTNEPRRFLIRSDTTEQWLKNNPLLGVGEIVADITTHKIKVGDGVHRFKELPYQFNELNLMIDTIVRLLANIDGSGTILESVRTTYELNEIYKTNINKGDICFVIEQGRFYYYDESWKPATTQLNNKNLVPVNTKNDLYIKYKYPDIGTQIYVISEEHFYFYNGSDWIRIKNSNDDIVISNVISLSELDNITHPLNGQVVYVLSQKLHYFYDGLSWKLLKDQISNNT